MTPGYADAWLCNISGCNEYAKPYNNSILCNPPPPGAIWAWVNGKLIGPSAEARTGRMRTTTHAQRPPGVSDSCEHLRTSNKYFISRSTFVFHACYRLFWSTVGAYIGYLSYHSIYSVSCQFWFRFYSRLIRYFLRLSQSTLTSLRLFNPCLLTRFFVSKISKMAAEVVVFGHSFVNHLGRYAKSWPNLGLDPARFHVSFRGVSSGKVRRGEKCVMNRWNLERLYAICPSTYGVFTDRR